MKSQNKVVPLFQSTDSIRIGDTVIHIDEDGRYRLNDFHKANGVLNKHRPKYFLATEQAKDMISELSKGGIPPLDSVHGGAKKGTYVVKELVYAYAMWADAKFAVHVIQTFDRVSKQEHAEVKRLTDQIASKRYQEISPDCLKGVLKESNNLEARIGYLALIDKGWAIEQYIDFRKRFYYPRLKLLNT